MGMLRRQNLFQDFQGFQLEFQRLAVVAQAAVGSAHIVVGGGQMGMLRRQNLFTDFQVFQFEFQCLAVVAQVAIDGAEVIVHGGEIFCIFQAFFQRGKMPLIKISGGIVLGKVKSKTTAVIDPISFQIFQMLCRQGKDFCKLGKFDSVIFLITELSPKRMEKISAMLIRRLQLRPAHQPDDRVDGEQTIFSTQPAPLAQSGECLAHLLGQGGAEVFDIQTSLRQERGTAEDALFDIGNLCNLEHNAKPLVDMQLLRGLIVVCFDFREILLGQGAVFNSFQHFIRRYGNPVVGQRPGNQVDGKGMALNGLNQ